MQSSAARRLFPRAGRAGGLTLIFGLELIALALAYQFLADIECGLTEASGACNLLRSMVLRALVVLGVVALLVRAWPDTFAAFLQHAQAHRNATARLVHALGLMVMLLPLALFWGEDLSRHFAVALWPWLIGAVLAVGGGMLWLAPASAWMLAIGTRGRAAVPILIAAVVLPDIVNQIQPIWDWQELASLTFNAVAALLTALGFDPVVEAQDYIIGIEEFFVSVAPQCSGVEGFALVLMFLAIYAFIFKADVRIDRLFLVLLPLGLLASWLLNIVRIALLILIGARISPDIAVNGFHSYAGWLMFTALSFALIAVAQNLSWLHRDGGQHKAPALPLSEDAVAARLLPFAAFMVTGTVVAAVFPNPGAGAPLVTVVLALAVAMFLPVFRALSWRPDAVAIGSGLLVGAGWLALAPAADSELADILAGLPAWALGLWILARIVGTSVLVPIVEEMFFRGYLLARLDGPGPGRRIMAIVVSSLAFALLHGRWLEAGIAGLVFAAVMLRRGRVTDAIWSHVVANSVVATGSALTGDWSLI